MRRFLLALLAVFSLNAVADETWKPFPYDQSAFDYSGDKLHTA